MPVLRFVIIFAVLIVCVSQPRAADLQPRLRRPVALAASNDGQWLFTANRDSGTVSVVNADARTVRAEIPVGGRLNDIAALDGTRLLTVDEEHHRLVLLTGGVDEWKVSSTLDIARFPVRLKVDGSRSRCFVTSLWSRSLTVVDLSHLGAEPNAEMHATKVIPLPFEPREMCLTPDDSMLIVADAFQGTLVVIDTGRAEIIATHRLPGHNIRGLTIDADERRLLIAGQELNPLARSTRDDVHWGNMISNLLVSLPLDDVCNPDADIARGRVVRYLGEPGNAAGDPGPVAVTPAGELIVVLSGVSEVAIGRSDDEYLLHRTPVGRRPVAALPVSDRVYVADMFSDSVSVLDLPLAKHSQQIPLGPQPELTPAQVGETLFFDSRLSHDGWMSCHSCHTDGHTNGRLNDNFSDGSFGAPKRTLSLLGVAETGPWAWGGSVEPLEEQVTNSITKTMQGADVSDERVAALTAYLKTLAAPAVSSNPSGTPPDAEIDRGRELFRSLDCQRCHAPPTYTSRGVYDVGLSDSVGNTKFNPPSLRGVGTRRSFLHDARAASLDQVFGEHGHQLNRKLTAAELKALIRFLRTL